MQNDIAIMDLVKYDPIKGCFVLKPQQQVEYWPGTNIVKSKNNAFSWRGAPSQITRQLNPNVHKVSRQTTTFTIYSKAYKHK